MDEQGNGTGEHDGRPGALSVVRLTLSSDWQDPKLGHAGADAGTYCALVTLVTLVTLETGAVATPSW